MTRPPNTPAGDVYELVTENTTPPQSWLRRAVDVVTNLVPLGARGTDDGAMILSVRERATGIEVFRHVEDAGDDDEDHLVDGIQADLELLSAADFKVRWVD